MTAETKIRSLVKSILWRTMATLVTFGLVYFLTGNVFESAEITALAALVSMTAYYFHERLWNRISWGRIEQVEQRVVEQRVVEQRVAPPHN